MDIEQTTDVNENMEVIAEPARLQEVTPKGLMRSEEYNMITRD